MSDQVKVDAEPPLIRSENRLQETKADQILLENQVMRRDTFAARDGLGIRNRGGQDRNGGKMRKDEG